MVVGALLLDPNLENMGYGRNDYAADEMAEKAISSQEFSDKLIFFNLGEKPPIWETY